jgi:hypothetical protein
MRSKRFVYIFAALATMVIFFPFRDRLWAPYVGACAGYSVLVFGLRRFKQKSRVSGSGISIPAVNALLTHSTFLAIVVSWVWLLSVLAPHLPYAFRTEDTNRPYFLLAFVGILGLMLLEMIEQRWLRAETDAGVSDPQKTLAKQGEPQS